MKIDITKFFKIIENVETRNVSHFEYTAGEFVEVACRFWTPRSTSNTYTFVIKYDRPLIITVKPLMSDKTKNFEIQYDDLYAPDYAETPVEVLNALRNKLLTLGEGHLNLRISKV